MLRSRLASLRTLLVLAVALPFTIAGCDSRTPNRAGNSSGSANLNNCTIPNSDIVSGCTGGKDCIPSIDGITPDDDRVLDADEARGLNDNERVIGVLLGNRTLAVPLSMLWTHEIVNVDDWAGRTFAVTYCPLTGSSLAFDRSSIDGAEFGVSGLLFQNNLVMYDRRSGESLWPQMQRKASCGENVGTELDMLPVVEMEWGRWRALHPDTKVVTDGGDFGRRYPYDDYRSPNTDPLFDMSVDDRRPPKELVLGLPAGPDGGLALPFGELNANEAPRVVTVSVGGTEQTVFWAPEANAAVAFETSTVFSVRNGTIIDTETESEWTVDGRAVSGPREGDQLEPVSTAYVSFWFAWAAFQPDTGIWTDDTE